MENLPSSSSSQGGRHHNPSMDLQSPTIPAIHYHFCNCFTFLVSSVLRIFNCFRHPTEIEDSSPADRSMQERGACPSSPMVCDDDQNATTSTSHYQVFINHRGSDVKKTLASVIHHCLQTKGLQVFLDKDEFQPGQPLKSTIEEAIRTSSVHIAIFSKRYAESDWCLKELSLMLQTRAPIIPVFYDVRPKDLRWIEKGEYASAFNKHEKKGRFDLPTISAWKSALNRVSYVSGLDLHDPNTLKGDEGQLLRSLEDSVFQNLKPVPLEVATDPVGLDQAICDFENFVASEQQNKKVKIVGIVGLGGSGKTTLAKEFFNRKNLSFERSSFLFDLRDASSKNILPDLQSKLLQDLLHIKDCKIRNVSEGKGIMRERLQSLTPRALIVLDDIDHSSQVEDLLVMDVLGSDSLILITSRDEEAVKFSEASIYKIKSLSPNHAQDLFCKHAFQQPYPMVGFENLVKRFCEKCGGLPLFLKVMGAHLRVNGSNDREVWEDELKYIPEGILNILHVSYNALPKEEKQIFLDIACFFLGEEKNLAIKVWDTCEGRGLLRLKILVNKCLVEFERNCFKMHDVVRDFGREIANKESPCRLWNENQAVNFREQRKATKDFRGVMAATRYSSQPSYEPPWEGIELSTLKILAIDGDCFDEQIGGKLKNLAWLRWFQCPHTDISPMLISTKNLTVLELFFRDIRVLPPRGEQVHLRELGIVRTAPSMLSIPQNVCPRLEHLEVSSNYSLVKVERLPPKLLKLNLGNCDNLQELPALDHLQQLRELDISFCSELRELPNLQHLVFLETLRAHNCRMLQHLQGLEHLSHLRHLNISECLQLSQLPKLQHLSSLETVDVSYCTKVQHIQGLEHLPQLRYLDISDCWQLSQLPKLQQLPSLEVLKASGCFRLQHIQGLEHLPQLRYLNISGCSELQEFPNLADAISLEEVEADGCWKLQGIRGLDHLQKLKSLTLSTYDSRAIWNAMEHMKKLPRRMFFGVGAPVNSLDIADLAMIDLNIDKCLNVRQLGALAEKENPPTCFLLCFVVQVPNDGSEYLNVRMSDKNGKGVLEWETRAHEGEWVYAVICNHQKDDDDKNGKVVRVYTTDEFTSATDMVKQFWEERDCKVKRVWMATGGKEHVLEAAQKLFAI